MVLKILVHPFNLKSLTEYKNRPSLFSACTAVNKAETKKEIRVVSDQFKTKAKRPLNSRLSKANTEKIGTAKMPNWDDALYKYVEELKAYKN